MATNGRTERFLYKIFGHFRTANAPERIAEEIVAVILNPAFRIHPTRRFSGRFGTAAVYERVCHSSLRQLLVRRSSIGDPRQMRLLPSLAFPFESLSYCQGPECSSQTGPNIANV